VLGEEEWGLGACKNMMAVCCRKGELLDACITGGPWLGWLSAGIGDIHCWNLRLPAINILVQ
jgi:hypothetical protein